MLKPKLKHLRHPLHTLHVATRLIAARWQMDSIARHSKHSFLGDPRYTLQSVTDGFAPRLQPPSEDTALLERICAAYNAAISQQSSLSKIYQATPWWEEVRRRSLGPVMRALQAYDIAALRGMYNNLFRDPCSTGLASVPYGKTPAYFGNAMKDVHRHVYLSGALYRLDYWKAETGNRFQVHDLAAPPIGNPYGAMIEGTLVAARSEFHHYFAHRVAGLLNPGAATVAEIGGGFGGMAYYLLRDRPGVRYIDFDLPESTALASYYLMKHFPHLTFVLYGEAALTEEALARADVVLMPLSEMERIRTSSVDLTFSSHSMSDLAPEAATCYLETIARITQNYFLFLGSDLSSKSLQAVINTASLPFHLKEKRDSLWNDPRLKNTGETECLYSIEHAQRHESVSHEESAHAGG